MDLFKFIRRGSKQPKQVDQTPQSRDMRDFTALTETKSGSSGSSPIAVPLPVAGKTAVVIPSFSTSAKPNPNSALRITDNLFGSTDLSTLRSSSRDTRDLLRKLGKASPEVSSSNYAHARVGIPRRYTAVARNLDGTFNRDATRLLHAVLTRMNLLGDSVKNKFDDSLSIRSLCESWVSDLRIYGACCAELVLDKARVPYKIQPVSFSQIRLYPSSDGKGVVPKQSIGGQEIDLNIPTFFMVALDQDLLDAYPSSPIESVVHGVMFSFEFMNDVRRIIGKVIHPRYKVEIDEEKFRKWVPPDIAADNEAVIAYMEEVITQVGSMMEGLRPEEAIVMFNTMGVELVDHGNTNLSNEYKAIDGMIGSKLTTGTKTMPTVLGLGNGTANVASSETMLFIKNVEGSTTLKLDEMMSVVMTQAIRLLGQDVYVEFQFDPVDLRPDLELESFRSQKQSRVLDLLSIGFVTDDEACVMLTGTMTPDGYVPKSGTGFRQGTAQQTAGGPSEQGGNYGGASNSGSALNKTLQPKTPTGGGRGDNKRNGGA